MHPRSIFLASALAGAVFAMVALFLSPVSAQETSRNITMTPNPDGKTYTVIIGNGDSGSTVPPPNSNQPSPAAPQPAPASHTSTIPARRDDLTSNDPPNWTAEACENDETGGLNVFLHSAFKAQAFTLDDLDKLDFAVPEDPGTASGTRLSLFTFLDGSLRRRLVRLHDYIWPACTNHVVTKPDTHLLYNLRRYVRDGQIHESLFVIVPNYDERLCVSIGKPSAGGIKLNVGPAFSIASDNHTIVDETDDVKSVDEATLEREAFRCVIQDDPVTHSRNVYMMKELIGRTKLEGATAWTLH